MSSSFQAFPPPLPAVVYPASVTGTQPSSYSNGSYGAVFIALAVIIVVSAIACFLGRLCSKRHQRSNQPEGKHSHGHGPSHDRNHSGNSNQYQNGRSKEKGIPEFGLHTNQGDIEFGFDEKISTVKPTVNGEARRYMATENGENSR
ncbi:hypothetical protein Nepgr_027955 [Nepenthes gracilis]|uniref:Transmembrane protein n=1 Tax=Nepenthes gracilis TaxID=150966 RepID=A0AAD3Y1P5_NEPGR|nr:hypothetical protein Nepgr_027955 [Nepenthes gracilis]